MNCNRVCWAALLASALGGTFVSTANADWIITMSGGLAGSAKISANGGVVAQYDNAGNFIRVIDQGLDTTNDVEIGPDGKIYVGDVAGGSGTIRRYDTPTSPRVNFATGIRSYRIAFGPDYNSDGVSDIWATTASNDQVRVRSGADGSDLGVFFQQTTTPRLVGSGIVWGPDTDGDGKGDLWVSSGSGFMYVLSGNFAPLGPATVLSNNYVASFADEDDLVVGPDGKVYGTEYQRNSVYRHNAAGSLEFVAQAQVPAGNKMYGTGLEFEPGTGKLLVATRLNEVNANPGLVWQFTAPGYSDNPTPTFISQASIQADYGVNAYLRGITYYNAVPEPSSLVLAGLCAMVAAGIRRRRP